MGTARIENIFRTRSLLDNPMPNAPSFHLLLQQEISTEMDIVNATNNSAKPWAVSVYELNYIVGQDTYTINVPDFGKVLYVERVQGDPYIRYVTVNFDDVTNMHYGTVWQNWYGGAYGTVPWVNETPERMSFYRDGVLNSQYMVRIQPQPMQSWTYRIHYLPGVLGNNDPLESAMQLPEYAQLVQVRNAIALLPYTRWSDDEAKDDAHRLRILKGLEYQSSIKEPLLRTYIRSIAIPKIQTVSDWND